MISFSFAAPRWLPALAVLAIGGLAFTFTGCDDTSVAPPPTEERSTQPTDGEAPLPPDVRLRIQYDQTEVTYSNVWPGSIVGNNTQGKEARSKEQGAKLMTDYEKIHEIRSYDNEGYLHRSYEYLDGSHPGQNMPPEAYSQLKSEMPYDPKDRNPVTRFELAGNSMKFIREDGTVAHQAPVDPERYRVDPSKLDSLRNLRTDTSDTESRRTAIRRSLRQQGLSLTQIDKNRVSFTRKLDGKSIASEVKKVVDLRIGRPIYLKYLLKNGKTDMVITYNYVRKSGLPVKKRSVTYNFDDRTGDWGVVSRTEILRRDISVQFD
jgi:hypothetical protein